MSSNICTFPHPSPSHRLRFYLSRETLSLICNFLQETQTYWKTRSFPKQSSVTLISSMVQLTRYLLTVCIYLACEQVRGFSSRCVTSSVGLSKKDITGSRYCDINIKRSARCCVDCIARARNIFQAISLTFAKRSWYSSIESEHDR